MKFLQVVYSAFSRPVCRIKRRLYKSGVLRAERAPLIVLSVGNLALGGSEKTPLALELLDFLRKIGRRPALVTRGYKGAWERSGGVLSDGRTIAGTWREAGDEPFLAALRCPSAGIYVGKNRAASCRRAHDAGFDVAVLDDGFQHLRLRRDLDIVLHDPAARAPLRESSAALAAADIVLMKKTPGGRTLRTGRAEVFPYGVREQGLVPLEGGPVRSLSALQGHRIFAFCGIARPARFFSLLEEYGVSPASRAAFPDHFAYPDRSLAGLASAARSADCGILLTTEKDAVKIRGRRNELSGLDVFVLRIGLDLPGAFYEAVRAVAGRSDGGYS